MEPGESNPEERSQEVGEETELEEGEPEESSQKRGSQKSSHRTTRTESNTWSKMETSLHTTPPNHPVSVAGTKRTPSMLSQQPPKLNPPPQMNRQRKMELSRTPYPMPSERFGTGAFKPAGLAGSSTLLSFNHDSQILS